MHAISQVLVAEVVGVTSSEDLPVVDNSVHRFIMGNNLHTSTLITGILCGTQYIP